MRYFGGLTAAESSAALNLEINRVRRQLRPGEAWLPQEMIPAAPVEESPRAN